MKCFLCPRRCGVERGKRVGVCGCSDIMQVAKVMLHTFEEPCISGTRGSGAIFFSGCNLRCGYCQNAAISNFNAIENAEKANNVLAYSNAQLADVMLDLQFRGAHNINLVTAAHFVMQVASGIKIAKNNGLKIPVIYNSSAYETVDAIRMLSGLVDVYLPDYKYFEPQLALKYSNAADYPIVARGAIGEMLAQQPSCKFDDSGLITRGLIIRHLVLPSHHADSLNVIKDIATNFKGAYLSLMSQYTPDFNKTGDPSLNRRVTSYEYNAVLNLAADLNLPGYMQQRTSSKKIFTPKF